MNTKGKRDNIVNSIGDAVVCESDVKLLEGPHWLSDRIIGFYFEYMHKYMFEDSKNLCFISPEVSQFLKLVDKEEINCFIQPLDLKCKEVILLAVNNSTDPSRPGGSHWSLLVYTSQANRFYHFDSSSSMNNEAARALSNKIYPYLNGTKNKTNSPDLPFTEVHSVLQQSNGYDCGVHVICNAKHSTRHIMLYGSPDGLATLRDKDIKEMRMNVKKLILDKTINCH